MSGESHSLLFLDHLIYGYIWELKCYQICVQMAVSWLAIFSVLLYPQMRMPLCNVCICIVIASFVSVHPLFTCFALFLPPILIVNFHGSSSHLNVHRWKSHEAPFYSSNVALIQKHSPATDYHWFISHISIKPSNTRLEEFVLTPPLSLFLPFHL